MEQIHKLEATMASWYKNAPHLPKETSMWIAKNAWWLVIIAIILGGFGILSLVSIVFFAGTILASFGGVIGAIIGGIAIMAVVTSMLFGIVSIILGCLAISPLHAMSKKGWSLLFLIVLVEVVALAVSLVFTLDLFGTIWGLLWVAVGTYFLFEIREYFTPTVTNKKPAATKPE